MTEVRPLRPDEWRVWKGLRLQALADSPDAFGETLASAVQRPDSYWIEYAQTADLPDRQALLAERSGRPVGMVRLRIADSDYPVRVNVYAMWVDPRVRGHGVGRALIATAIEWARARDAAEVVLRVTEGNEPATGLYRSVGFVETGESEPLRNGSNLKVLTMALDLSGKAREG